MEWFREQAGFERGLTVGRAVEVRWTWCHGYYGGKATVAKINGKSVRVTLDEPVRSAYSEGWAAGHAITVPLVLDLVKWSRNNGVFPQQEG